MSQVRDPLHMWGATDRPNAFDPYVRQMIIDSGWDFVLLTSTRMNWSDPESRRLFVVGMDRDLSYYFTRVVDERFDGGLSTSAERIVDLVDELDPTAWHSTGPMHSFRDYHKPDLPSFQITRPPQYDGWRRASNPKDRIGFADEFGELIEVPEHD